jgi:hypothetical protein
MARASAVVLMVIWLAFVIAEAMRPDFVDLSTSTLGQGASLAVVFAGYVIGLRKELAGGIAAIVGTAAFFAVVLTTTEKVPGLAALMFAVPGVLYLLAWLYDERRRLRL